MHCRRVDVSGIDEMLDLRDGDPASHRGERVEVHRCLVEDEVAVGVTNFGVHEGVVGGDPLLHDIAQIAEHASLFGWGRHCDRTISGVTPRQTAVGDGATDTRGGEECRYPGATGP